MSSRQTGTSGSMEVPTIDLNSAPGTGDSWDRPRWLVYAWAAAEIVFISNPWQVSSTLRVKILRAFGADIGENVIFRPRTRVKFPWKLHVGDSCWIGEGVWFHNQDHIYVGNDVAISQETFLTTGSHAHRRDMALITRPITIESGVWITSRCIVLGGGEHRSFSRGIPTYCREWTNRAEQHCSGTWSFEGGFPIWRPLARQT